ncbi:DNA primase [Candidatus Babeliales bacterium]|nr:DNA primase [Candidatus Babeliales bacterium]MBP9843363.1 DNA primase [Candidatus Babeliales bacterium]
MNLFNFIKNSVRILDVINEYTTLKKSGGLYWKSPCPFHQEKTPSFTVSPDKEIFYCFGCHESGDVISFIAKIEKMSQFDAAQYLIEKYNLQVPDAIKSSVNQSKQNRDDKDSYFALCKLVANWCHDQLFLYETALNYVHSRKFNQQSITQFTLGYFPKGNMAIKNLLEQASAQGFLTKDLIQAGVLFQGQTTLYSPFEGRIIFPIKDHLGRHCGFGGRVFMPDDDRSKYYNSKENQFFQKGTLLYGLDIAKKNIQHDDIAFLVEGYTDCIAMHSYGYKNSIATLGTACTLDHLKKIANYTQQLYIMYDGDDAGQQAILRLTQLCWTIDIEPKVICLPKDSDPASFLYKNQDLKPYITHAKDVFSFFLQNKGHDFQNKNLKEKLQATASITELITNLQDPLKRDILLLQASEILQIPLEILRKEYTVSNKHAEKAPQETVNNNILSPLETKIFSAILHYPKLLNSENITLLTAGLPDPYNELLTRIIKIIEPDRNIPLYKIQEQLTTSEQALINQLLFALEETSIETAFEQMLLQFQKKHWKSIVVNIKMKLQKATQDSNNEEIQTIVTAFQAIKLKLIKNGNL